MGVISFSATNSQVKEVSAASNIDDSQRYWILNIDSTYGLKENNDSDHSYVGQSYSSLATPFTFTPVLGKENTYVIRNLYNGNYLVRDRSKDYVRYYTDIPDGEYFYEWVLSYSNNYYYLKTTEATPYYLNLNGGKWYATDWASAVADNCRLNLLSFDTATTSFVTAMRNISCDDGVTAPKVTGENSWESANTAYSSLISPAKNYLRWIKTDKDASDTTIEWAMSKYDYIVSKYNKVEPKIYTEFVTGRQIDRLMFDTLSVTSSNKDNNITIIVLISGLTLSVTFGVLYYLKKKAK